MSYNCGKRLTKIWEKFLLIRLSTKCTLRETTLARFLKPLYYVLEICLNEDYFLVKMVEKWEESNANMQAV